MHPREPKRGRCVWPSLSEEVQALFPDYVIEREVTAEGRHGDWTARPAADDLDDAALQEKTLRASTVEALHELLETASNTNGPARR
ncbi:hypothetical protein [Nonomuraea bangladeshensis]|uniref:hypothetical protein n=1 Tax=Nonomuraea bangladeshensis TaxID=404385 RepID=UPI003C2ED85C